MSLLGEAVDDGSGVSDVAGAGIGVQNESVLALDASKSVLGETVGDDGVVDGGWNAGGGVRAGFESVGAGIALVLVLRVAVLDGLGLWVLHDLHLLAGHAVGGELVSVLAPSAEHAALGGAVGDLFLLHNVVKDLVKVVGVVVVLDQLPVARPGRAGAGGAGEGHAAAAAAAASLVVGLRLLGADVVLARSGGDGAHAFLQDSCWDSDHDPPLPEAEAEPLLEA